MGRGGPENRTPDALERPAAKSDGEAWILVGGIWKRINFTEHAMTTAPMIKPGTSICSALTFRARRAPLSSPAVKHPLEPYTYRYRLS